MLKYGKGVICTDVSKIKKYNLDAILFQERPVGEPKMHIINGPTNRPIGQPQQLQQLQQQSTTIYLHNILKIIIMIMIMVLIITCPATETANIHSNTIQHNNHEGLTDLFSYYGGEERWVVG